MKYELLQVFFCFVISYSNLQNGKGCEICRQNQCVKICSDMIGCRVKKSSSNKTCTLYQKRTLYISVSRVVFVSEFLALFMFVRKCYNNVLRVDVLNF